ncbi:MAG: V-type ATPase 116kDa subunit family protein [Persephonella sp.]|nr:V-type ATPase 116kDa subunit family protein [Persephonella sp.]
MLLKTPSVFKPFERLIQNFSYPKYGEINPTVPFALSFLVLFGVMFGDVGHGLVLVAVGYFLKQKYRDAGEIFILSGLSSAFFGFLYGSFFGFHDLIPHLLFSPIKNINSILIMSLVIGVIMLSLSFLLNIISLFRRKKIKALIAGEGGLL